MKKDRQRRTTYATPIVDVVELKNEQGFAKTTPGDTETFGTDSEGGWTE